MKRNGIRHIFTAPYHPASNGQAERTVQTFKSSLTKMAPNGESIETRVSRFFFMYRITPQTTTGASPCQLLFNRQLRSAFTKIKPDVNQRVKGKQLETERHSNRMKPLREFAVHEVVMIRNYGIGHKWITGTICRRVGSVTYEVQIRDRIVQRHVDQMLPANDLILPEAVLG